MSVFGEFAKQFATLWQHKNTKFSQEEQRVANLFRLQYPSQTLTVKIRLICERVPEYLTLEFVALLSAHEAFIQKLPERSSIILDICIISALYYLSNKCPDYCICPRAISAL